jgi:flagellar basal body-associated protein FliL
MAAPQSIGDQFSESSGTEMERGGSSIVRIVSILVALVLTAALLVGYLIWRKSHAEKIAAEQSSQKKTVAQPALPAKVQIFMDDAVRKGAQAVITGTVHNISNENLSNLTLEAELTHRKDGSKEAISFVIDPKDLAPNQDGKYSLALTGDYSSISIIHVKAGAQSEEVGFKTAPGAKRPPERPIEIRTVIINRPPQSKHGEEFINTPDNPAKVP